MKDEVYRMQCEGCGVKDGAHAENVSDGDRGRDLAAMERSREASTKVTRTRAHVRTHGGACA